MTNARRNQVAEEDSVLVGHRYDYADAFEIDVPPGDTRNPQQMFRDAVRQGPSWLHAIPTLHRQLLRFRLGPSASPNHIFGWRVVSSDAQTVHLEAAGPLMRGVIVGRRSRSGTVVFTTFVEYVRSAPARVIWALVGPLHRRTVPYLLEVGASTSPVEIT